MALILSLDTMAERYKMLPSELMNRATTFDIYVMDAALSYHDYKRKLSEGKVAETYSTEELQQIMQKARSK